LAIQISVALTYVEQDVLLQPVPIIPKGPAYYYIIICLMLLNFNSQNYALV